MDNSHAKVLIVDDEADLAELVTESFEMENLQADVAHSGDEAVAKCKENDYLVILSDNHMPGMEGLELFARLSELYKHKFLFYLCTGDLVADKSDFTASGGTDIITKPYDVFALIEKVKEDLKQLGV